jgi:hypothetical protein
VRRRVDCIRLSGIVPGLDLADSVRWRFLAGEMSRESTSILTSSSNDRIIGVGRLIDSSVEEAVFERP